MSLPEDLFFVLDEIEPVWQHVHLLCCFFAALFILGRLFCAFVVSYIILLHGITSDAEYVMVNLGVLAVCPIWIFSAF